MLYYKLHPWIFCNYGRQTFVNLSIFSLYIYQFGNVCKFSGYLFPFCLLVVAFLLHLFFERGSLKKTMSDINGQHIRLKIARCNRSLPGMDLAYFSYEVILSDFGWLCLQQTTTANQAIFIILIIYPSFLKCFIDIAKPTNRNCFGF